VVRAFCADSPHASSGFVQEGDSRPLRGPDGQFRPVAQVEPMEDTFIGGWTMPVPRQPSPRPSPRPTQPGDGNVQFGIPGPPPLLSPHLLQTGYPFIRQPSASVPSTLHGLPTSSDESPLAQLSPVERSQTLHLRKTTMQPNLQFMCGPLLRYDTVDEHGVWHGAALIVSKCSWFSMSASVRALTTSLSFPAHGGTLIRSCRRWVDVRAVSDSQVLLGPQTFCSVP
jgi:hypothetical protein